MILWYNTIMKFLVKLGLILTLLTSFAQAITFDVLVLPADILNPKENYYGFEEVSEIVADDIIDNFNATNGKIKSPDLYTVRTKLNQNSELKQNVNTVLKKYKDTNKLDYANLKKISNAFGCKSVLVVSSSVVTNKNSLKRNIWEVLNVSTAFEISYPYRLETSVVLLDNVNDLVMWSNNFSTKIGTNDNYFMASNYAQAYDELEKIKLYSKTVIAPSASQNIMLRFFPKAIRPIDKKFEDNNGGALRFERTLPEMQKKKDNSEPFYGDMIFGI